MAKFEPQVSTDQMSASQAAQRLGVSRQQMNKLIGAGHFPKTVLIGTYLALNIEEVESVRKLRESGAFSE